MLLTKTNIEKIHRKFANRKELYERADVNKVESKK